jgi:hypothetical protein
LVIKLNGKLRTTNQNLDSIPQIRNDILEANIIDDCLELKTSCVRDCSGNTFVRYEQNIEAKSPTEGNAQTI